MQNGINYGLRLMEKESKKVLSPLVNLTAFTNSLQGFSFLLEGLLVAANWSSSAIQRIEFRIHT